MLIVRPGLSPRFKPGTVAASLAGVWGSLAANITFLSRYSIVDASTLDKKTVEIQAWIIITGLLITSALTALVNHRYYGLGFQSDDFVEFYAAGKLAGTGHLYDYQVIHDLEIKYHPGILTLPFLRLPIEAWMMKPLSFLPFPAARVLWFVISSIAAVLCVLLWPTGTVATRAALAAWFLPFTNVVICGHDVVFFLLLSGIALRLFLNQREFAAGLVIGCCVFKYHLGLGLFVYLLAARKWRTIGAASLSAAIIVASSFVFEGPLWFAQYRAALASPVADLGGFTQPNIRGLLSRAAMGLGPEILVSLIFLIGTAIACRKIQPRTGISVALALGLLVGHHAFQYDLVLALPLLMELWVAGRRWIKAPLLYPPLYELPYLLGLRAWAFFATQIIIVVCIALGMIALLNLRTHDSWRPLQQED